jgi:hypothetical protein
MKQVQQAVFTWTHNERAAGYQLAGASDGLSAMDCRELAWWGPGHNALAELGPEATSLNFFPLPSGAYCVSRTVRTDWPVRDCGGQRVYTRCLAVPPETLERFANQPLALARAAAAAGAFDVLDEISDVLEPLDLPGRAPAVDQASLEVLAREVGPWGVGRLVEAAQESACLAVGGPLPAEQLISGLLECLPPQCRPAICFSTGLKYASRRPFRVLPLPSDPAAREWLAHQGAVTILDLAGQQPRRGGLADHWARLIERVLASAQVPLLAAELAQPRPDLTPADLPAMGLQLLESLEATTLQKAEDPCRRSHAAHRRFGKSRSGNAAAGTAALPSAELDPDSPRVLEKLEALDDAVFDAMGGSAEAIQRLGALWPAVRTELGDQIVCESREHYLRYALSIWQECLDGGTVCDPTRAMHALDVLCVLFDEV